MITEHQRPPFVAVDPGVLSAEANVWRSMCHLSGRSPAFRRALSSGHIICPSVNGLPS